jgi:hypothetical protein
MHITDRRGHSEVLVSPLADSVPAPAERALLAGKYDSAIDSDSAYEQFAGGIDKQGGAGSRREPGRNRTARPVNTGRRRDNARQPDSDRRRQAGDPQHRSHHRPRDRPPDHPRGVLGSLRR